MSKFNIGDRVITVENGEIRRGVVRNVFDFLAMVVVEFDDGSIEKVRSEWMAFEPKTEVKPEVEAKEEKKPIEKSEITITPDEFRDLAVRMAYAESGGSLGLSFAFTRFAAHLHDALFMAEADNA